MINETPTAKLTDDENVIYHIVQEAGKEGIRSADVAKKCKKATSEATKILNNLQHLGYI
jgi:Mn-dependent DtxR family transcriptional regulator